MTKAKPEKFDARNCPDWVPLTSGEFRGWAARIDRRLGAIEQEFEALNRKVDKMAVDVSKLEADIQTLATGYTALQSENAQLKDALASADADKAQAVADAVAAEDADAQSKINEADAIADAVLNPPAPDNGGGGDDPAPVDDGS